MKSELDIDKLRSLLHKYYEGETTPEEEALICSCFSEGAEDIPQDLTDDRIFFSSMKELSSCSAAPEIPDDLLGKINRSIAEKSSVVSDERKKRWRHSFFIAGAAAAACLVLAAGIGFITIPDIHKPPTPDGLAETPTATKTNAPTAISKRSDAKTTAETTGQKPQSAAAELQKNTKVTESGVSPNAADGYMEITDPEEARKIIMEIGRLLSNNTRQTNEAIRMVETTVDEYKEITKSILK
ncbi:MAG: hypothetical protein K2K93_10475 [Muribaculaceae bacterium]|nr:hypothetical protein [Muribaculaceae bacterium]